VGQRTECRATAIVLVLALLGAGCASGRPSNRFITRGGDAGPIELMEGPIPAIPALSETAIQAAVAKARRARVPTLPVRTVEAIDDDLGAALREVGTTPGPEASVRVGQAYARLGILDLAIEHFDAALRQDRRYAAAYDGRARVWRRWGLVGYALADAHRAVYFAPYSAPAQNTLGTVLVMMGDCQAARAAYERALALDARAAYAIRNLELVRLTAQQPEGGCRKDIGRTEPERVPRPSAGAR
jgi:tetratricopeptide (TPR) repeat protein